MLYIYAIYNLIQYAASHSFHIDIEINQKSFQEVISISIINSVILDNFINTFE